MAVGLIESMSGPWRPDDYHDTYSERVEQLIEDKRHGRELVTAAQPPAATEMSDLLTALQRSIDSARNGPDRRAGNERDLSEASKAELTEMARGLDVPGRSKMDRAELEKAVAEASGD